MSTAPGWAVVKSNGLIHIKTVSDTRRAAIINWLVTEKQVRIYTYHTDADIEAIWKHYGSYVECRQITVSLADPLERGQALTARQRDGEAR